MMREIGGLEDYWSIDWQSLATRLGSTESGLTAHQAASLLTTVGPNRVADSDRFSALRLLTRQFESPLVMILGIATGITVLLQQWLDAGIILAMVLGSAALGFQQEYRASSALEVLRQRLALKARVIRDGSARELAFTQIVPGDVIELAAGDLIPADGVVVRATDFLVTQASITGESFPVEKRRGVVEPGAPLSARSNCVFLGSSVRSGTALMMAVRTGDRTEFGSIAARLRQRPPETDFARGVRQFGELLLRVMLVIVILVFTVNSLLDRPVLDSLLFAVALAVGLSPELLPAIITVTLAAGARAMSQRGVIVRRLEAIENLGSMDILCTDKTGTLTLGHIELSESLDARGQPSQEVRRLAVINACLETGIRNPLDEALTALGRREGLDAQGLIKIDEIPYDFMRRRLTIVVAEDGHPDEHLLVTKGAFAQMLDVCTCVERAGKQERLDEQSRSELQSIFDEKGQQGLRVLAVATRSLSAQPDYDRSDEQGLCFRGFLVFIDPPKPDAKSTVMALAALGIQIKVISGDHRHVTAHLARAVGLDPRSMLTGEQITQLRDEALWRLAPQTDLFVEIDPQQKERIVRALQKTGHSVGYLGDGINDAPALHAADVGISVEGAVDVARESADIILLRPDLEVLRIGVVDGRRSAANTLKYIAITTSANFGNMVSMALAAPFLPFFPLMAKQILLNNILSDLPSMAISTDQVDPELLQQPQRWDMKEIRRFMIVFGLISSAFDLMTFAVLIVGFEASEPHFQTAWFMISLMTELVVVLVLRTHRSAIRSQPSTLLLWSTILVCAAAVACPYLGAVSLVFGFVPLTGAEMMVSAGIVAAYLITTELVKRRTQLNPSTRVA